MEQFTNISIKVNVDILKLFLLNKYKSLHIKLLLLKKKDSISNFVFIFWENAALNESKEECLVMV